MDDFNDKTPSKTVSPLTTQKSNAGSASSKVDLARAAAGRILGRYPDYSKSTPSYTMAIIEVLTRYSDGVIEKLVDPVTGISGKCKFLPTAADFVEQANEISAKVWADKDFDARYAGIASAKVMPIGYVPDSDRLDEDERRARHEYVQGRLREFKAEVAQGIKEEATGSDFSWQEQKPASNELKALIELQKQGYKLA